MVIRVLVVDDSALVRQLLAKGLSFDPELQVVGTASDPYAARDKIAQLRPDVMTLDVEMPRMDGVEFLRRLMPQHPIPVVMVSSLTKRSATTTLAALEAGAVDFVQKPAAGMTDGLKALVVELTAKVKIAAKAQVAHLKGSCAQVQRVVHAPLNALAASTDKIIALGASTGGTEAVREVLFELPPTSPGIVVVQHMPPLFTKLYAERLDRECRLATKEAEDGDRVTSGRVLLAPGGVHMRLFRTGGHYEVRLDGTTKVSGHCPSVDILFESVAKHAGRHAVGALLTGMGSDGAEGLLSMRQAGAFTIGQDEATSVVYGMPKAAADRGACCVTRPLNEIAMTAFRHHQKSEAQ